MSRLYHGVLTCLLWCWDHPIGWISLVLAVFLSLVFRDPLVDTVIEGTQAKAGVLDPLGAELEPGPEAYFQIMAGLAKSLKLCLSPAS